MGITHTPTVITVIMVLGCGVRVTGAMVDVILVTGAVIGGIVDSAFFGQLSCQGRKRSIKKVFLK